MTKEEYDLQKEYTICIFSLGMTTKNSGKIYLRSPNVIVIHFFPAATLHKNG